MPFDGEHPIIDIWPHPLTAEERHSIVAAPGQTLEDVMAPTLPAVLPAVASVNGNLVARSEWAGVVLQPTDVIQVRAKLEGGGGGGSNPIKAILSIAVLVAAPYAAAAILGTTAAAITAGAAGIGASLLSAGIAVGGIMVVNALFPPRLPKINTPSLADRAGAGGGDGSARQLYSLTNGSNRSRVHEPLQMLLGKHRMFPDLAAQEYTEYGSDGDQYLNQIFDFGIGNLSLDEIRIGETLLSQFDAVEKQQQTSTITLVAGNVDTITGGELTHNVALARQTAANTTAIAFDLVGQNYQINDQGRINGREVLVELHYRELGSTGSWNSHSATLRTPNGGEGRNLVRRTFKYTGLTAAAYEVQVILQTEHDETEERVTFKAQCPAIRAYQDSEADFTGRNPLALRVKATGQLYGRLETINALVSARIPDWNGTDWMAVRATSNPASVLRSWYLGYRVNSILRAGYGMSTDLVNDAQLAAFHKHCEDNGLECNIVVTDDRDEDQVATMIAQCGWGRVDFSSGRYGVIFENSNQPVSAVITPANIIAGTLQISYDNENLADEIIGTFLDRDSDFQENTLRRPVPQFTITGEFPITIPLEGITDGEQAAKEINRTAAAQFYHQRIIQWEMSEEGFLGIGIGDVIAAGNALLADGQGSRLVSIATGRIQLTLPVEIQEPQGPCWIWLPDGEVHSTTYRRSASDMMVLTLGDAMPNIDSDVDVDDPLDYRISLFPDAEPYKFLRITSIEPTGPGRFRFVARDELTQYYNARVSDLTHPLIPIDASGIPAVEGFGVSENELGVRIVTWSPVTAEIDGYHLRYGPDGATWSAMTDLVAPLVNAPPVELMDRPDAGTWTFAIRAVKDGRRGPVAYVTETLGDVVAGLDGTDGSGIEYIFAATSTLTIDTADRPSNDWGFDTPGTDAGDTPLTPSMLWFDGGADIGFGEDKPYLWRAERNVPGTPAVGADVAAAWVDTYQRSGRDTDTAPAGAWKMPVIVGRFAVDGAQGPSGIDGADGDDGNGIEYIFARTATANAPSETPSNNWGFDTPGVHHDGSGTASTVWTDAAPSLTAALPYLWRAIRPVEGVPANGAEVGGDGWSQVHIISRFGPPGPAGADGADGQQGVDGLDGDDGEGVEHIFAATDTDVSSIPNNQLPLDTWTFDMPQTRNMLEWKDGVEGTGYSEAKPLLWRSSRKVPGQPTAGATPDTAAGWGSWSTPTIVLRFGVGVEHIFARTAAGSTPSAPDNSWGFDSPSAPWMDAAPTLTAALPVLWRSQRLVRGVPAQGDTVKAEWTAASIVGRFGQDGPAGADGTDGLPGGAGSDGDDGNGVEYIFARTADTVDAIPANQLPLNTWGYDNPGTVNGLTWNDAAPSLSAALPRLWRAERVVPGVPADGTKPTGVGDWSTPSVEGELGRGLEFIFAVTADANAPATTPSNDWGYDTPGINADGTGTASTVWFDAAPTLTEDNPYLWRAQRVVNGAPASGEAVPGAWTTPTIEQRFGAAGSPGVDGTDGENAFGYEYIFAKTVDTFTSLPNGVLPDNAWGYNAGGTSTA